MTGNRPKHTLPLRRRDRRRLLALLLPVLLLSACAGAPPAPPAGPFGSHPSRLAAVGIAVQAGAFASLDNAVRLTEALQNRGLEATFFKDDDGLFKVRFGDFASKEEARRRARRLQRDGALDVFYIVVPEQLAAAQRERKGEDFVRERIVFTAKNFLGLPYRWGGASPKRGFDCSGLTMTAYRLNGYQLPRTSREQFRAGSPISPKALQPADLVFFATRSGKEVSHVGIYIGDGRFIHAPGRGKTIRIDSLSQKYYRRRLVGARHFL
ncbi:MAG: NlpC/P60 family protein [Desulfobacteraceae bacterium]|jgi:hypothetical protein